MNSPLNVRQRDGSTNGSLLGPLPEPPRGPAWHKQLGINLWPRSTQMAVAAATALALVTLVLVMVLGSWRSNAEAWRLHAADLAGDREAAAIEVERLEDHVAALTDELAASERALERAQEAAALAEDEAQESAERELKDRMAEAEAELDKARREIAETRSELEEREAKLTQEEALQARSTFGTGIHVVGQDIEPGTYRTEGSGSCYWARLRGLGGELGDVIANGLPQGPATVKIRPSDVAFETSGCGQWTRR